MESKELKQTVPATAEELPLASDLLEEIDEIEAGLDSLCTDKKL